MKTINVPLKLKYKDNIYYVLNTSDLNNSMVSELISVLDVSEIKYFRRFNTIYVHEEGIMNLVIGFSHEYEFYFQGFSL